jgi:hypothetical protein
VALFSVRPAHSHNPASGVHVIVAAFWQLQTFVSSLLWGVRRRSNASLPVAWISVELVPRAVGTSPHRTFTTFWDVVPRNSVRIRRRFGGIHCIYPQERMKSSKQSLLRNSPTLKMAPVCSSEAAVNFYQYVASRPTIIAFFVGTAGTYPHIL